MLKGRKDSEGLLDALTGGEVGEAGQYDAERDQLDREFIGLLKSYLLPVARYFRTEVRGVHLLPRESGCLCISNHTLFGIDSVALFTQIYMETGRVFRGLGEHALFKLPQVGEVFAKLGAVDGNLENATRLMRAGHWAICYPGGTRDAFKHKSERYQLKWHGRVGYLRAALAADVPLVPIAGIGIDDAFVTLGRERKLGRALFGSSKYDLPIFVGLGVLPLPVKFTFHVCRPISLSARFGLGPSDADAPSEALHEVHMQVWSETQSWINQHLRRRSSRFF